MLQYYLVIYAAHDKCHFRASTHSHPYADYIDFQNSVKALSSSSLLHDYWLHCWYVDSSLCMFSVILKLIFSTFIGVVESNQAYGLEVSWLSLELIYFQGNMNLQLKWLLLMESFLVDYNIIQTSFVIRYLLEIISKGLYFILTLKYNFKCISSFFYRNIFK